MSEENVGVVRRAFAALGDAKPEDLTDDVLREFFDPAVEWVPVPQGVLAGGSYLGFEGVRDFAADFLGAWDDLRAEPEEIRQAHDRVISVVRMTGRVDDLEVEEAWSSLFTLRDGRIVRVEGFASRDGALEAAGPSA